MSGATNNKDGSKKRWLHGRAVQNGELRFLSVSSIEKGDSSKPTGCLRRWHYQYIGGIKEPPADHLEKGERLHGEIAHYLTTGEKVLSSQVMAGLHMIPEPGPDLKVEHDIIPTMPDGKSGLHLAPLRAAGIPIVGAIDLIHGRGTNKGTDNIEETRDPDGTIEVIDWKTCRTLNHAKTGPGLLKTIQMAGYGKYVFEAEPDAKLVRLSHGYFPSQGVPKKVTIRVDREQIDNAWEHANRVASSIRDAAKEINPDLVEANTEACNSYGRQCPAYSVCKATQSNVLSQFIAPAEQLISTGNLTKMSNSILAQIKAKQGATTEAAPVKKSIFGSIGQTVTQTPTNLEEEIAKLEAQEKALTQDMPAILPPEAPESNPLLASKPKTQNAFTEAMAAVVEETPVVEAAPEPEAPKKGRARKKKEVEVEPVQITNIVVHNKAPEPTVEATLAEVLEEALTEPKPGVINLFIDCSVDGVTTESLWPLVDHLCGIMNEQSAPAKDFRLVDQEHQFGYGRWKGALAAYIRATPLDAGNYTLNHAQGEVAQIVIETMREVVRKSGGIVVMGAR